jgi:DNA-directed RNA polymerase specialized sigma24 family protein
MDDPPDTGFDATTSDGDLWAAVAELPDKQRGAIALRFLGDLPYADIAVVLECSEAAARQNVRAGLASLRVEVTR